MNLVETLLNFLYLWMTSDSQKSGRASLVGFSAAILTVAKTLLYWLVEFFSGMRHTGHNELSDYILLWVVSKIISSDNPFLFFHPQHH